MSKTWQECEALDKECAAKVVALKKDSPDDKDAIDAAVKEMLAARESLKQALEAEIAKLEAAGADAAELKAKLPAAPSKSKKV